MQKEWVGHLALDCKQWGLQCVDVTEKVRKIRRKGLGKTHKSVPKVNKDCRTSLQRWLERKRIKRKIDCDCMETVTKSVEIDGQLGLSLHRGSKTKGAFCRKENEKVLLRSGKSFGGRQEVSDKNQAQRMASSKSLIKLGLDRDFCSHQAQRRKGSISG